MKLKIRIIIFLILLIAFVSTFQTTYSRYSTSANANITTDIARWKISLNTNDITNTSTQSITIEPTINNTSTGVPVAPGKVAPGSSGYFDFVIDPSKVDVSFEYSISIGTSGNDIPDLKPVSYKKCTGAGCNVDSATAVNITGGTATITGNNLYGASGGTGTATAYTFSPMTIRVIFKWNDGSGQTMSDSQDTAIGLKAANGETINTKFTATLNFQQIVGS